MKHSLFFISGIALMLFTACAESNQSDSETFAERVEYAIALHGGAGVISRDIDPEIKQQYVDSLAEALELGRSMLADGADALDVVEQVVRLLEDNPLYNAGRGAVMTNAETFELDASIMDGRNLAAGAVAGVTTVKNPITLARHVMENSRHVLFAGEGAERFADGAGVERVEQSWFYTERRHQQLIRARERDEVTLDHDDSAQSMNPYQAIDDNKYGTVGVAVLDRNGNLAAGTSTGGMTNKRFGRVGDSPIVGAGTYANNKSCAISSTGTGEEFIRHAVAFQICAIMEYTGASLNEAARIVIHDKLQPGDGGIIGVSHTGEIAMIFNSRGMFRGAADSNGRFEVAIWDENEAEASR
ncbi:MAG: isoaspartyl peptidase/L-asparaginase [Candidatus Cyclonatronum sp.]|uniref:isoaspartyl peptidase/L-asparaginase family protein n=1 Tax=Cyclonatronum sp. TaxID=3024185 RepID=UPI0025BFED19|nr:isoaspartyl peptidase/L-asparaginase [Cyclonatronum sp.]MCC5932992.1 isoaspartyl peptidase/L-asparaginase [Balneolales bacterium]MCH8485291.1 isoaspartyl peptidase/L-asparaginase [Cyclonatronum sp.]